MTEELKSLLSEKIGEIISGQADIPTAQKKKVTDTATTSMVDAIKKQASSSSITDLISMFGGGASGSLQKTLTSTVSSALVSKANLSKGIADTVAGVVVSAVSSMLSKDSKGGGGIDLGSLLGGLAGGGNAKSGGGLADVLGGLFKK